MRSNQIKNSDSTYLNILNRHIKQSLDYKQHAMIIPLRVLTGIYGYYEVKAELTLV